MVKLNVPFYTPVREYKKYKMEFDHAIQNVVEQGDFIMGKEIETFEQEIAEFTGAQHAIAVASGTDALVISSDLLGFKNGAEVITPVFTFFASTSCIVRIGGKPVFADIDENTFSINPNQIEEKITKNTRGIIPVHLFLQTAPMQEIINIAKKYDLKVLEDSAEAFGMETKIDGKFKHAGTIGDMGVYSFFPTKTLGAYGDAGMIVTNDRQLAYLAKTYRVHGSLTKYIHDYIGYNSRLDTIQAAIMRVKHNRTDQSIKQRKIHALHYIDRLKDLDYIKIPEIHHNNKEVYYVFNILTDKRDALIDCLKKNTIGYSVYYPIPLHLQKCFLYLNYKKGDFPIAEKISKTIIALPMYPELSEDEIDYICDVIIQFFKYKNNK